MMYFMFAIIIFIICLRFVFLYMYTYKKTSVYLLKRSIKKNNFHVLYQPIIDLSNGSVVGAEALLRWKISGDHMMSPDEFIPLAENNGLMNALTKSLFDIIFSELGDFLNVYADKFISINLSASSIQHKMTINVLKTKIKLYDLQPSQIHLEATERASFSSEKIRSIFFELQKFGFKLYMDDFGTGYSNLLTLQNFNFDALKVDKSFVNKIKPGRSSTLVLDSIINLSHLLGMNIVAEGVETQFQASYLKKSGVQYAQGWLFGKPMCAEELKINMCASNAKNLNIAHCNSH